MFKIGSYIAPNCILRSSKYIWTFFNTYSLEPLDAGAIIVSFNLLNYKIGLYILLFIVNNIIGE